MKGFRRSYHGKNLAVAIVEVDTVVALPIAIDWNTHTLHPMFTFSNVATIAMSHPEYFRISNATFFQSESDS